MSAKARASRPWRGGNLMQRLITYVRIAGRDGS